jgi:type IV pilus assembly protein PilM
MFKKGLLAIDIGSSNIKLVHGRALRNKIEIYEYHIVETPVDSVSDGKITKVDSVFHALNNSIKENRINAEKTVFTITGTGVITRDIQVPASTDEEIQQMIEFEAQQYFPVDLENYVLDFKVMETVYTQEGAFNRVMLAAVPDKQVEEYMKLPDMMKMRPEAVDLPANCVLKYFFGMGDRIKRNDTALNPEMAEEFAVIDMGSETTGVCIFNKGNLVFNRILLNGSNEIERQISQILGMDLQEAEVIKSHREKVYDEAAAAGEEDTDGIGGIIKPALDAMLADINRFFDFHHSRDGGKLSRIYLCGGGSLLKGVDSYVSSYFNVPAERLSPDKSIVYRGKKGGEAFERDFCFLVNAIGALVRV